MNQSPALSASRDTIPEAHAEDVLWTINDLAR